ncbi:MAG: alpha-amylase [Ilumatobacteraceae bacterium]|nr:alpha-amylase [Ilumatobacteraceae bacterium]
MTPFEAPSAARPVVGWWRDAVVYEVYPRSFADSNGDGVGDLEGVRHHLDHLDALGIDAIWLSPFYMSPLADGGYDVADHRDVDPLLGTLDGFDALVADAHARQIRIIVDIVANHTSDRHPWFQDALAAGRGSAARDRYIFRDGDGERPPSDWRSHFGGGAWQRVADGQWYCHLFTREQPDLNWDHDEVRQYFLDTLRFWADRGVDGFRVDMAHTLVKDLAAPLRSQPDLDLHLPLDGSDPLYDRDGVHVVYEGWRRVFDEYDPPRAAVAETWYPTNARTYLYARPSELGQVFDFSLQQCAWDRDQFVAAIRRSLDDHRIAGGGLTWVLSSHDAVRHPSRLALPVAVRPDAWLLSNGTAPHIDPQLAARRGRAATLMMLALPGSAYLYQGEELGLLEVADLSPSSVHDPTWERSGHTVRGRDGCRVPLPWTRAGTSFGFGAGGSWLPQPATWGACSVEAQTGVIGSSLEMYRAALHLRRRLQVADDEVEWQDSGVGIVHFRRANGWECIVNMTAEPVRVAASQVLISSRRLDGGLLPCDAAAWTHAG